MGSVVGEHIMGGRCPKCIGSASSEKEEVLCQLGLGPDPWIATLDMKPLPSQHKRQWMQTAVVQDLML